MRSLRIYILFATMAACFAQPTRLEILSRPDDHTRRNGVSSMAAVPEFSRDGNYVLFLSSAANLTTNGPSLPRALNLYMTDRRTHATTLISAGLNGEPANDAVVNFEISKNNRRILFETAASNIVANDTNNASDVFIRDLDLNRTILVSSNTNGVVSRRGASFATMSGDATKVAFIAGERSFATNSTSAAFNVFVRDMASAVTTALILPAPYTLQFPHDVSISDDGRWIAFSANVMTTNPVVAYFGSDFVTDFQAGTTVRIDDGAAMSPYEPIMTPDAKFITFGEPNAGGSGVTNTILRFSIETGQTDTIASNNLRTVTRPVAISDDGRAILYLEAEGYRIFRDDFGSRAFPPALDGTPIALSTTFGMAAMSADGRIVTFSTDAQLLPNDPDDGEMRTYVYDVDQDTLAKIPVSGVGEPVSNPVPNADGSLVVFTALSGFQDHGEPSINNIYIWDRNSGALDLLSRSYLGGFENSDRADSKFNERASLSDDGNKLAYISNAPGVNVTDTNGTWDVFVMDRVTGRKQLVSVAADGTSAGAANSYSPVISGDGRVVAFLSRATNLVDGVGYLAPQLYVRDLEAGVTYLVGNTNGFGSHGGIEAQSLSFNHDGTRLGFVSSASDLTSLPSLGYRQIYIYDTTNHAVAMASYNSNGTAGGTGHAGNPVISPDGRWVAFRSRAVDMQITGGGLYLRDLTSGALKHPGSPNGGTIGTPVAATVFDPTSTILYYGATGGVFQAYNILSGVQTRLVTGMVDASASDDGHWVAFSRRDGNTFPPRNQIWLRDTIAGVETMLSTNSAAGVSGNLTSTHPHITSDGRFVVFQSRANNLVPNDNNGTADIFMHDRDRQRLDLVSAGPSGRTANGASLRPVISPDDSFVAFMSYASDLIGHDYNDGSDIFAAYFPPPDSNGNGIDDRWEVAQFGSLTHDMNVDTDGDGMSDAAEFAAGTDPQQANSILRVTGASAAAAETIAVRWAAAPGRSYRVQARSKLDQSSQWQNVSDPVIASQADSALEVPLPVGASELYFRIVRAD